MANLTPVLVWSDVFQLETNTPVLGGPGGPSNSQAQALLNRTSFLDTPNGSSRVGHIANVIGATNNTAQNKLRETLSVKDFGAVGNGVANDLPAFVAGMAAGPVFVPKEVYNTNAAITATGGFYSFGGTFNGPVPIDSGIPAFGAGVLRVMSFGNLNSIIGITRNNLPPNTLSFPTGVTGYGRNDSNGNLVFGIYAEARQYASTGCVTNEVASFNHTVAPSPNLPPNRGIGTPENQPIAFSVGAGGLFDSSIGIHIIREGSLPRKFLTGMYFNYDSCIDYGLYVAAHATLGGPVTSAVIENSGVGINLRLQTTGTATPTSAMLVCLNSAGVEQMAIKQDGRLAFAITVTQATVGVAGAAPAIPATPTGYLKISVNGFPKVIPYYEP